MENNINNNSQSFISNLINSFSILDIVQHYLNVSKKGQNYWALCPFHADKNPSLSISPSKNIFKCFVCNAKGNAISFVMLFKKCPFIEALKEIKEILNIDDANLDKYINAAKCASKEEIEIFDINTKAAFFFHRTLFNKESETCLNYLKNRQISEEIIDFYGLGYAPKTAKRNYLINLFEMVNKEKNESYLLLKAGLLYLNDDEDFVDFFYDRLIIPIKNEHGDIAGFSGRIINSNEKNKYINTKTTLVFKKENILFNFFAFDKSTVSEIYIVEGYMDIFALRRIGITNAVASMGTAFTDNQINLIKKYPNIKNIILCLDNDKAGNEATIALSEKLVKNKLNIFLVKPFDQKYKDIDELTQFFDKQTCLSFLNNQVGFIEYQIDILKRQNLSYKDKKIELRNIIDMLNRFAFNLEFFTEDKKKISEFFEIGIRELESLIDVKKPKKDLLNSNKTYQTTSNSNNKSLNHYSEFWNFFENDIEDEKKSLESKENFEESSLIKSRNNTFKKQESDLIFNLIYSKELAKLYIQYLGFIYFNSGSNSAISKVLKMIIYFVKLELKKQEYKSENIIKNVLESNELIDIDKKYFLSVLDYKNKFDDLPELKKNNHSDDQKSKSKSEKNFDQGINLLKSLKQDQFNRGLSELVRKKANYELEGKQELLKLTSIEIHNLTNEKNEFWNKMNQIKTQSR